MIASFFFFLTYLYFLIRFENFYPCDERSIKNGSLNEQIIKNIWILAYAGKV